MGKKKKIDAKCRQRLIQDIIAAQQDPVTLGEKHGLDADNLAAWVGEPKNQRLLSGLCLLADLQTQVLLSRYRLLAAGRLIRLATEDGADGGRDVARRACVDLLKLDLKRAEAVGVAGGGADAGESEDEAGVMSLRRLLYGAAGEDVDSKQNGTANSPLTGEAVVPDVEGE